MRPDRGHYQVEQDPVTAFRGLRTASGVVPVLAPAGRELRDPGFDRRGDLAIQEGKERNLLLVAGRLCRSFLASPDKTAAGAWRLPGGRPADRFRGDVPLWRGVL